MLIADRNGMVVGSGGWQNPYVTDGLIGLWDGEWNVAGGQHDDSATTWVDISGNNRDAVLSGTYSWGSNYWHVESVSGQGLATWPAQNLGDSQTVEFVLEPTASNSYGRIIAEATGISSPIVWNDHFSYLYMYGYNEDSGRYIGDTIPNFDIRDRHLHQITHPAVGKFGYYIDGVYVWTGSFNSSQNGTGGPTGYFANVPNYSRGINADYFTMRRYDRVLTAEELAANAAVDASRFGVTLAS